MLRDKTGAPAAAPRTISTPRLLLTKISHSYVPQIFAEYTVNLAAYMATPHPSDPSGTESFVSRSLKLWDEGTDLTFVILSSTDMEFLGVCSICARVAGEPGPKGLPDLGIWVRVLSDRLSFSRLQAPSVSLYYMVLTALDQSTGPWPWLRDGSRWRIGELGQARAGRNWRLLFP